MQYHNRDKQCEKRFNAAQWAAISHRDGPALVLAGPGSGKTTVLTERIRYLVQECRIKPDQIMVVTFTKAAALEMQKRFERLIGMLLPVRFGTFHSIYYHILRDTYQEEFPNYLKEYCIDPKTRQVNFDFLEEECLKILRQRPDILARWRGYAHYLLVDEYQDINSAQGQLLYLLSAPDYHIFMVGDDDQSIYGFRGAGTELMLSLPEQYPGLRLIVLEYNYRSDPTIIECAGRVINENKKRFDKAQKAGRARAKADHPVVAKGFEDTASEIGEIISLCRQWEKAGKLETSAILFRKNADSFDLVNALRRAGIPFRGGERGQKLWENFVWEDMRAYWNLIHGNFNRGNFIRIMNRPYRGLRRADCSGEILDLVRMSARFDRESLPGRSIKKLLTDLKRAGGLSFYSAIMYIRKGMGYERYLQEGADGGRKCLENNLEVLHRIQELAARYTDWESMEREVIREEKGEAKCEREGLHIMTYHGSKGLEYENVILPELNEHIVPHRKAASEDEIEEERRMFYVAMTRAKDHLYLFYRTGTQKEPELPSRFLRCLLDQDHSSSSTSSSNSALSRYSSKASATDSYSSSSSM